MDNGANDHQKGQEKNSASSVLYSTDPLCESQCLLSSEHGKAHHFCSGPSPCQDVPRRSKGSSRKYWEQQAHRLLKEQRPIKDLVEFLQQVTWQDFHSGSSQERSALNKHKPEKPQASAYAGFGMYSHGGMHGTTNWTKECPWLTRLLNRVIQHYSPQQVWTSVTVSYNMRTEPHKDKFNLQGLHNVIIPVIKPQQGGEVWTEGVEPKSLNRIQDLQCAGETKLGTLHPLKGPIYLDPKRWHATMPWVGDRLVLIGYALRGHRQLPEHTRTQLKRWGFQIPWKHERRPEQPRLRPAPGVHQGFLASSWEQDAQRLNDQEGDARAAPEAWRDSTIRMDQGSTQVPLDRDLRERTECDDREGCLSHRESLQDQGSPSGEDGRVQAGVQLQDQLRPTPGLADQAPDGEAGPSVREQFPRIREAQLLDICRDSSARSLVQCLDSGDSNQREGVSLEIEAIRPMVPGPQSQRQAETRAGHPLPRDREGDDESPRLWEHQGNVLHGTSQHLNRDRGRVDPGGEPDRAHHGAGDRAPPAQGDGDEEQRRIPQWQGQGFVKDDQVSSQAMGSDLESEADEDLVCPGEISALSFATAKKIGECYEQAMLSSVHALCSQKIKVLEVGGSEGSGLVHECEKHFGTGSAMWLSDWNGGDLESSRGQEFVLNAIKDHQPLCVWFRPDTSPFSPVQKMNQKSPEQAQRLQAKQTQAMRQYEGFAQVVRATAQLGITCVLEMSDSSPVWEQQWVQELQEVVGLYRGTCQGCQVNLRNYQGALSCKGWGLASTDGAFVQNMSLVCDGRHAKSKGGGLGQTCQREYPREFSRRVLRFLERQGSWFEIARDFQTSRDTCLVVEGVAEMEPAAGLEDIPADKRRHIFQHLRRIHCATGHCSKKYLRDNLRKRGASKDVLRCADHFSCDVCDERSRPDPRSQSTLSEIPPKWHTLQCDAFSWNHPQSGEKWQCMLGIDEGCRLRVGRVLFQHASKTPSAQDFIDYFEGH